MCYVFLFAASKTYLDMEGSVQMYGSFLIFTAINVVGFFLVYWVAPVTEGKSLVEIEQYFSGETRSWIIHVDVLIRVLSTSPDQVWVYGTGWGVWSRRRLFKDHTLYIATQIVINILVNMKRHWLTVYINLIFQNDVEIFYYQLMHIMLKNTELLKHSKITLQHVSVYIETIFRELQSVLG